jgi:hypothetical protein
MGRYCGEDTMTGGIGMKLALIKQLVSKLLLISNLSNLCCPSCFTLLSMLTKCNIIPNNTIMFDLYSNALIIIINSGFMVTINIEKVIIKQFVSFQHWILVKKKEIILICRKNTEFTEKFFVSKILYFCGHITWP